MEKITKEQMFRSVSDLSSGIAHGLKEIANGNANFVGIVKNKADELNINLDVLSDKFGKDDKGVMKVVNAFRGVSVMGKSWGDQHAVILQHSPYLRQCFLRLWNDMQGIGHNHNVKGLLGIG